MKAPKTLVLGSLVLMSVLYACKKNDSTPVPGKTDAKWSGETMNVKLKFSGDFQTEESPLGRQASNARINPDSTLYAVDVRMSTYWLYGQGIYTRLDSLSLDLPKGTFYTIKVTAFKKGSGLGLYETIDSVSSGRFLPGGPLYRHITNRLVRDSVGPESLRRNFLDVLSNFWISSNASSYDNYTYSELDSYYGTYEGVPRDSQMAYITVPLKRVTYGIRFKPQNFTEGRLLVDYSNLSKSKMLTFNNTYDTVYTYTANEFINGENLASALPVYLRWMRADGSIQDLGSVRINPKRNTLTTISVTAPSPGNGTPLGIYITENNWKSDTTVVVK